VSDDRPICLVLDTSAVLAFVRQSVHVGEVLVEVDDNAAVAAIPLAYLVDLACLVGAARDAIDHGRLAFLAEHPSTVVVPAEVAGWQTLGVLCGLTGAFAPASAALTAMDAGCWVLTAHPNVYAAVAGGELAVPIEG
jgi:hypothetical protein